MTEAQLKKYGQAAARVGKALISALTNPEVIAATDRILERSKARAAENSFAGKTATVLGVVRDPAISAGLNAALGFAAASMLPEEPPLKK